MWRLAVEMAVVACGKDSGESRTVSVPFLASDHGEKCPFMHAISAYVLVAKIPLSSFCVYILVTWRCCVVITANLQLTAPYHRNQPKILNTAASLSNASMYNI